MWRERSGAAGTVDFWANVSDGTGAGVMGAVAAGTEGTGIETIGLTPFGFLSSLAFLDCWRVNGRFIALRACWIPKKNRDGESQLEFFKLFGSLDECLHISCRRIKLLPHFSLTGAYTAGALNEEQGRFAQYTTTVYVTMDLFSPLSPPLLLFHFHFLFIFLLSSFSSFSYFSPVVSFSSEFPCVPTYLAAAVGNFGKSRGPVEQLLFDRHLSEPAMTDCRGRRIRRQRQRRRGRRSFLQRYS